jgi:type IV pilus assembly protein PilX
MGEKYIMSEHAMNSKHKTAFLNKQKYLKQQGVVLFFALVALVVMSLAAVALIRSVDTSTLIAGNLASKQSATTSADMGMETAINWMASQANLATLNADIATSGYYSTQAANPVTGFNWDANDSLPATSTATGADVIVNGTDGSGNTIRYVIQRMCSAVGAPSAANCLFGPPGVNTNSSAVMDATRAGANVAPDPSPIYRITARVIGVKNTVSYIQAFVY